MKDETKDNSFYLKHIVASINKIRRYLDGVTFEGFCKDDMRISAVTREIEIIGEAASKLAKDFKETHKNVPWRDIIDMRNIFIHHYFGVNEEIIWGTYKNDLDDLEKEILLILKP